ncbi:ras-related and estrogen-regulated growth inhibitor-like isoform X2 [Mercenaria mercenaria]|uniref:ras-related and estrogen-regulated growth inhibitor-like isoform X2 n=1 Tax=Mercenaria mercenaria TaxID=6596 RepID=UPI001E1DA4F2|nr:ras-related and estrogen-regulated growth inhibitor-like isoform X2 [Mercenaria mercenaria]
MSAGAAGTLASENSVGGAKPYLKRKKSSLGETKIAVLGAEGVGKSALSVRFITKRFIGEYDQSTESKYKYRTIVDGEEMAFEVLDTRSVNEDCGVREDVLRWADGYVLVYSMISRKSFVMLQEVQKKVEEFRKGASIPIVVIGNKADLAHMRQVTQEEGQTFAETLGCPFLEVSASEDVTNVTEAFHSLCREIVDYKRRSRTFFERVFGAFGKEKVSS